MRFSARFPKILLIAGLFAGSAHTATAGFINGSFESGFSGWNAQDFSSPFFGLSYQQAGVSPGFRFFTSAPTNGQWAAVTGFDTTVPGHANLSQVIAIGTGISTVTFDYRAAWDMQDFTGSTLARRFDVEVLTANGSTVLLDQNILTALPGTQNYDTGPLAGSLDVSAFANQNVMIRFDWYVPESHTGPAFFQLDNVGLSNSPVSSAPAPPGLILGLTGMTCLSGARLLGRRTARAAH
jgi:hypothetical protein